MDRRVFLSRSSSVAAATAASVLSVGCATSPMALNPTKSIPFFLVDAFTDKPFSGNPAPVVILREWLPDSRMQALASEMNMSEVAFVVNREVGKWDIRWFTPMREVPLNGHATLAAASVILETIEKSNDHIEFNAKAAQLKVERDGSSYLMTFPADATPRQVAIPAGAEADLGVRPTEYWVNSRNIAVFKNADEIRAVKSKISKTTTWTQGRHLMITAPGENGVDYVLRYFVPILGIPEDPVSGVVHCTLAPFWATRLKKTAFDVVQLSARGGKAKTGITSSGNVLIGGPCVRYVEGALLV